MSEPDSRGVIHPARLPTLTRHAPPADLASLVQWFWVPQWDLPPGHVRRVPILAFPSANLVVASHADTLEVTLSGSTTHATHRDLTNSGWAVGILLQPAGFATLLRLLAAGKPGEALTAARVVNSTTHVDAPGLADLVNAAMTVGGPEQATAAAGDWLRTHLPEPSPRELDGNLALALAADHTITTSGDLADALTMTVRTLERLTRDTMGVSPLQILRRFRLHEAALRLRATDHPISQVAADLGYADHAHFSTDFRRVIGQTPSAYRRQTADRQQ